jgi:YHS domain-containing protein
MQYAVGFQRLGHDAYYFETSSSWPYDPIRKTRVNTSEYAVSYLAQVAETFGLSDRWAYRRSYGDKAWLGLDRESAEELLAHADIVFSITGSTRLAEEGLEVGRLVYVCTDPVIHEVLFALGDEDVRTLVEEHDDVVTFGLNIGKFDCSLPPLPHLRAKTCQPVVLDLWQAGRPTKAEFTTVGNWRQEGRDTVFEGNTYYWSKHREYLKFIDLPKRTTQPVELATGLIQLSPEDSNVLKSNGWRLTDSHPLTVCSYRDYLQASRGEFTVAKDANVRLKSGWFSDRSACYLAAGRPVITQDTGFSRILPTGEGLFAFNTMDEILTAFEAIERDYERHSRAARDIAEEYFKAETVLARLLNDLGP